MNDDLPSFLQDFEDIFQEYFDSPHQLDSFLIKLNASGKKTKWMSVSCLYGRNDFHQVSGFTNAFTELQYLTCT